MFSDATSHVRDDNERGRRRPRCHESRAVDFALYAWLDMERGIAHGMWHGTGTGGRTGCIHIGQAYGVCLLVVRMLGEEGRVIFFCIIVLLSHSWRVRGDARRIKNRSDEVFLRECKYMM